MRAVIGTDRWRFTLFQSNIQLLPIQKIVIHPEWNARKAQNDIALVRTTKTITFNDRARPICLPSSDDLANEENTLGTGKLATIAGYGFTTDGFINVLPNRLQYVQIPVVRMDNCKQSYNRTRIPITDKMICAGTATYGRCTVSHSHVHFDSFLYSLYNTASLFALLWLKGALKGDSGSALITYENERAVHTGIVSFSLPCRLTGAPDVYTRTATYLRWIESVIAN